MGGLGVLSAPGARHERREEDQLDCSGALLVLLLAAASGQAEGSEAEHATATAQPVVAVEFEVVVTNAADQPLTDLEQREVDVVQEGRHQTLERFVATSEPGHYALRYVPDTGRPGNVAVWVRRKGTKVHGPNGGDLEPRVVRGLSELETALLQILEQGTEGDLGCPTAVLQFDWGPGGLRHVFTAEVPLARLKLDGISGRVQVLARIQGARGPARLLSLDRQVVVRSQLAPGERLIWTSSLTLEPGRYDVDLLVNDPNAGRHSRRSLGLSVPAEHEGIQLSSVTALQARGAFFEGDAQADAALVYEGVALMPKLEPVYERGAEARLGLFATLYPDPRNSAPVALSAELLLDGKKIAELPTVLPKPEASGEIRWAANMGTRNLPIGRWQLVLVAQQGATTARGQADFQVVEHLDAPLVRVPASW